jgi:putative component of membrane protein insertase Oxa1/YidC/SpoIIIJ protein YidD
MKSIFIILFLSSLIGQIKYPADSLLASSELSIFKKFGLLPIAGWQRISYNTNLFNCQFYPSCSNYGADAIQQFGVIRGGAMASERITRCNPFAFHYHLKLRRPFHDPDGRLVDPVIQSSIPGSRKSPLLAGLMSAILPGSGRIYAGRVLDGIMGMWMMYLVGNSAYNAIENERPIAGPLFGIAAGFVYLGEIYGGWRAAKFYQISEQRTKEKSFIRIK